MAKQKLPLLDRFMQFVSPEPNSGCWLWLGYTNHRGYGRFGVGSITDGSSRMDMAHRISYQLHRGEIPAGFFVCHRCDTPSCVNPDHLFLGSRQDNATDMATKNRGRTSSMGIPYGVGMDRRVRPRPFVAYGYRLGKTYRLGVFATPQEAGEVARQFKIAALRKEI